MSSPDPDLSIQDGKPVYKFAFVSGATTYRFTSSSYAITDSNGTYTPAAITATQIITTNEMAKNGVQVTVPRDNALAQLFLGGVPETPTTLTIYRGHDPSAVGSTYWKGRVASAEASGDRVTLACEDIFTSMQRPGLRARYQKGCRHALYSPQCGVELASYANATVVTAQSGMTITVNPVSVSPELDGDYFAGGIVEFADGTRRYIVSQSGWVLTLLPPQVTLTLASPLPAVTLYPGCDHTTGDCKTRFDNLVNYGGFPFIPGKNPFQNAVTGSIA